MIASAEFNTAMLIKNNILYSARNIIVLFRDMQTLTLTKGLIYLFIATTIHAKV